MTPGVMGATISGGGASGETNQISDNYGVIGGGRRNQAGDNAGTASGERATVGGGDANTPLA